jgi:DNA-binding CsgD family transcriptional regulator/Tfp pilus assembly protein PilF
MLVGRQRELERLWGLFKESTTGNLRVALVAGEPGIGKTHLLEEVARRVRQEDTPILRGGASEAEGMPPYLPFLEALGEHIRTTTLDELRAQSGEIVPVLATILPELSLRLGDLSTSYLLPPEQARLRLYEAVGTFLAAIAAPRSLLLLLDDLQWADGATLDLLCYVARSQPNARLLILGAYREGEIIHRTAFERTRTELNRLRRLTIITPGPLAEKEVGVLAANLLGAPPERALNTLLAARSEGNPFFAEELLRGWQESGLLARAGGEIRLKSPIESELPAGIVSAVRQRITRLSPLAISCLRIGAIVGRSFDIALLAEVAEQDIEVIEEALQEAEQAQLIRATQPPGTFMFSHDTIRTCLYQEISAFRRSRLHTLIGHKLELRLDPTAAHQLAELAFHFARSRDRSLGAVYSLRAAEQASRTYAHQEAVEHYRTALLLVGERDPRRGEWLERLGEGALLSAAPRDAIEAFEAAQSWWLRAGNQHAAGRAALGLGRAYWRLEAIDRARAALQEAVSLLSAHPTTDTVRAMIELGSLLTLSLHEHTQARELLSQALLLAQQSGDLHLEAAAGRALGNLVLRAGEVKEAIVLFEQALLKADESSDALEAAEICSGLFLAYNWSGALERQEALLQRWLAYARRCHDPYQLRHLYLHLATSYAMRAHRVEAEEALSRGQHIVEQLGSPEPLAMLQWTQGILASFWGDLETAEKLLRAAIARFRELEPRSLVWWLGGLGFIQALAGKRKEALAVLHELEEMIAPLPAGAMPTAHTLCFMGAIVAHLGERTWAARLYPRLLLFRGQMHSFSVDRLIGALATLLGDYSTARSSLVAAREATRRCDLKAEYAFTLLAQADLELAEQGQAGAPSACAHLEEAVATLEQLGNKTAVRQIQDRLRQIARRETRPHLPAGLSPREAEVLRLVAQGKSNREIAAILVISERTVVNHLASVFNKTGVDNRAGAAAFAIRNGLAK